MQAERFMSLFAGLDRAYGKYTINSDSSGQKVGGKAKTVLDKITIDLWQAHLDGNQGLGVVPITDQGTSSWGAIDIDEYDLDLVALDATIKQQKIPCIVCRTKSGGAHLYLFTVEPVPAAIMRSKLMEIAGGLGYGGTEIFPKQVKLASERDVGNWINMPYFDSDKTMRYGLRDGESLTAEEFLDYAEALKIDQETLEKIEVRSDDPMADGPPCIQKLCKVGFPEGTRNNGLFVLGVYARLKYGDAWEEELDNLNRNYMDPPLGAREVSGVIKSLNKKEYFYKCNDQPIVAVCNKSLCMSRKFGIGSDDEELPYVLGTLVKIDTKPPLWFIDVDGHRLELTTDDLLMQDRFRRLCVEKIHKYPRKLKANIWERLISERLAELEIQEAPEDAGIDGQFLEVFAQFLRRPEAKTKDQLLMGKHWVEDARVFFRSNDLMAFLEKQRFRGLMSREIWALLRQLGAEHHQFNIKKTCVRCWSIPDKRDEATPFDLPGLSEKSPF